MEKQSIDGILQQYETNFPLYSSFTEKLEKLVNDILNENGLRVHSVTSRVKKRNSLKKKIESDKYSDISNITDICGLRIITFYSDDVDNVAKIISSELEVDKDHSVDKRELMDPDRFGYLSLHFVVKLSSSRLQLTEYRRFGDCQAEIQIRSILQHAWAEIEHDLGYKRKSAVPKQTQRRFSRLAGLFEIGDSEFISIRNSLREYEKSVPEEIKSNPKDVLIDKASLISFIETNYLVRSIEKSFSKLAKVPNSSDPWYAEHLVDQVKFLGFDNIEQLESALKEYKELLIDFGGECIKRLSVDPNSKLIFGVSVFYLGYFYICREGSIDKIKDYLRIFEIVPEMARDKLAKILFESYEKTVRKKE